MKRPSLPVILLVAAVLSAGAPLVAQGISPRLLDFGVKGGLALPSFFWTGDAGWNQSTVFALQGEAYAYACANLQPDFGIEVEAGYRGKGCSVEASDGHAKWYMDYFEVPLWAKWSARMDENSSFYGGIGGYMAWFLGGRYDFSTGVSGLDGVGKLSKGTAGDVTVVRPLDYGFLLVAGGEAGRMTFEGRFSVSIVKSMEFAPPSEFGGARGALNSGIDLIAGYRL